MKTQAETITRKVFVFAEAKSKFQLENLEPGEMPFDYIVKAYDYGDEKCVRIMEVEIDIDIPEGIDLTLECIKNLQEKIIAVRKEADDAIKELEDRIRNLALLEHRPVNDVDDSSGGVVVEDSEFDEDFVKPGGTL